MKLAIITELSKGIKVKCAIQILKNPQYLDILFYSTPSHVILLDDYR